MTKPRPSATSRYDDPLVRIERYKRLMRDELAASTATSYIGTLNLLLEWADDTLGVTDPWELETPDLVDFLNRPRFYEGRPGRPAQSADGKGANRTRKRERTSLRKFYGHFADQFKYPMLDLANPTLGLTEKIPVPKRVPRGHPIELCKRAVMREPQLKWKIAILLGYEAGARRGEIRRLAWVNPLDGQPDVDFQNNTIRLLGKNDKERQLPLLPTLKQHLARAYSEWETWPTWRQEQQPYVIPGHSADMPGAVNARSITKAVSNALCKANNFKPVARALHNLRHAFGTNAYKVTQDLVKVQDWMGHETIETTRIYVENNQAGDQEAARKLAQHYSRAN